MVFSDPSGRLPVGAFASVTFHFLHAGPLTIPVLVMPATSYLQPYVPPLPAKG